MMFNQTKESSFTVIGGAAGGIARAVTMAGCRVMFTASIGDAASPVAIISGPHWEHAGQVADYRHDVEAHAANRGYASVIGYWNEDRGWMHTVELPEGKTIDPREVAKKVGGKTLTDAIASEKRAHERFLQEVEGGRELRECEERIDAKAAIKAVELRPIYDAAKARVRTNAKGKPHGGDTRMLEYAFKKAAGYAGYSYCQYDKDCGLKLLTQYAEQGFAA